jgi:DNA-binding MarR family transcriptional regulator
MEEQTLKELNFDLWSAIDRLNHCILLIRQRELNQYGIAVQQLMILRTIKSLGSETTVSKIAKITGREIGVVSRQTVVLESDGLIKRTKAKPKSRRLIIELTDKGLEMTKIPRESKTVDSIFAVVGKEQRQQICSVLNKLSAKAKTYCKA